MDIRTAIPRLTPQYMAGLLDGEGCITITTSKKNDFRGRVILEMTSMYVLEALAVKYGVLLQKKKSRADRPGPRKAVFRVEFGGPPALNLLMEVFPYLIDKHDQAAIVIQFLRHRGRMQLIDGSVRARITPESRALYVNMVKELQRLKALSHDDA